MCYLCEKYYKPITVQHYTAVLVGCLGEFCWTYEQIGCTNGSWNGTGWYVRTYCTAMN